MGSQHERGSRPAIEPIPIDDEFVAGPEFVRVVGPVAYLAFYVDQISPAEFGGAIDRRIRRRLVMPYAVIDKLIRLLQFARDHPNETLAAARSEGATH